MPAIFFCFITMARASRLGTVGFLVSVLLYRLFWGLMKMRRERGSLIAATVVYAYPAIFGLAIVGVLFVGKLHKMVFGGGAQAASNAARQNQIHMAIPRFLENPIGHGPSQSGLAMGYSADSFITIDNYYITLALDYGIIGISAFLTIFGLAIVFGSRSAMARASVPGPRAFHARPALDRDVSLPGDEGLLQPAGRSFARLRDAPRRDACSASLSRLSRGPRSSVSGRTLPLFSPLRLRSYRCADPAHDLSWLQSMHGSRDTSEPAGWRSSLSVCHEWSARRGVGQVAAKAGWRQPQSYRASFRAER